MPPGPLEPAQWLARGPLLAAYIACLAGASALANCSLLAALYRSPTNGLFFLLLQVAIADVAVVLSLTPEIWTYHASNWIFGSTGCVAYRGLVVFATTVTSYLITTVALHALATINLEEKQLMKIHRRNDNDDDEEIRSSRHSLVAASDSSTPPRTMNLDYRESKTLIPIMQPTLFVWILSLSLSVPDFALATTVALNNQNAIVCTIVDSSQRLHLYSVLALLNLTLPIILMCIALILVIQKLRSRKRILLDQCESIAALKLSLCLIVMYLIMSVPRSSLTAYNIYFTSIIMSDTFIIESIQNNTPIMGMSFNCIYLATVLLRPIFSILILPSVKRALSYGHGNMNDV